MNRLEDICANAREANQSERKGQRMIFPGVWIWIWSITFDCMLNMMIYICVLNMMFALLYDNNLDYGDAETDQNITNTKPWLPTQVKTNGTKVEDCAKGNQVTSNQPTKSMKPVPQSQAIFYC